MGKVELLAPAGDMACFKAAVNAGADAVYLGGEEYGARAYASNFTKEELCEAIRYAHLFEVKVYLTVNTLVKEREIGGLCSFIAPFYEAGLDGVIVQDLGVLQVLQENFPGLLLHGSTQMCITGKYGAELLKESGISRVVPARELSLEEIKEIKEETGIEIETFIHGAMCYCYSGQCLFSSFLGGRSGNRGRCAGPCRLPYSLTDQKEVYPFSLKDMCTLPILPELMSAGIDSFKIEGRMKNPYYVAGVTGVYRKYMDLYEETLKGKGVYELDKKDMELLRSLYVRTELETGYYHRHNGKEMVTLEKPGYVTGNEKDFLWLKERFLDHDKKAELQCELVAHIGSPLRITVCAHNGIQVTLEGTTEVSKALNRPLSEADMKKQLSKTGNTPFYFQSVSVIMDEDLFIPLKEINELRRHALEEMKKRLSFVPGRAVHDKNTDKNGNSENGGKARIKKSSADTEIKIPSDGIKKFRIYVTTPEQLKTVLDFGKDRRKASGGAENKITGLQLHFTLLETLSENKDLAEQLKESGMAVYLCMPQVCRKKGTAYCDRFLTAELLETFQGFYCGSLDGAGYMIKRMKSAKIPLDSKEIMADYSLYTYNSKAVSFLEKLHITGIVGSYELNRYEWNELLQSYHIKENKQFTKEYLVYGHIPFMQSAGCVKKTFDQCDGKNTITYLKDRMGKKLPVMNFCQVCENTVFNGVPLVLYQEMEQIDCDEYRICFTVEDRKGIEAVLNSFILNMPLSVPEFTKGHYKKGIE
ncbi:MAG: U32 family peptidase [Lachnospiraceae bacterium]|nr:U32 family peptidase [Lachnospiraceae bacterium]